MVPRQLATSRQVGLRRAGGSPSWSSSTRPGSLRPSPAPGRGRELFILSGTADFRCGQRFAAGPGDFGFCRSVSLTRSSSASTRRCIPFRSPRRRVGVAAEVGGPAVERRLPDAGPADPGALATAAARHALEVPRPAPDPLTRVPCISNPLTRHISCSPALPTTSGHCAPRSRPSRQPCWSPHPLYRHRRTAARPEGAAGGARCSPGGDQRGVRTQRRPQRVGGAPLLDRIRGPGSQLTALGCSAPGADRRPALTWPAIGWGGAAAALPQSPC